MSESSSERRKRLSAMRMEAEKPEVVGEAELVVKFRNYVPHDASLEEDVSKDNNNNNNNNINNNNSELEDEKGITAKKRKGGTDGDVEAPISKKKDIRKKDDNGAADVIKRELDKQKRANKQLSSSESGEPKNLDHDLKMLVSGKLQKLQRRTQRAIVDIMRAKLAAPDI